MQRPLPRRSAGTRHSLALPAHSGLATETVCYNGLEWQAPPTREPCPTKFPPDSHCIPATTMSPIEPHSRSESPSTIPTQQKPSPTALVLAVSGAVAFAIMGDSLLYAILPLAAGSLGLSPRHVGLLLSANRLIRLFSNTWLSALFARFGRTAPSFIRQFLVSSQLLPMGWAGDSLSFSSHGWDGESAGRVCGRVPFSRSGPAVIPTQAG